MIKKYEFTASNALKIHTLFWNKNIFKDEDFYFETPPNLFLTSRILSCLLTLVHHSTVACPDESFFAIFSSLSDFQYSFFLFVYTFFPLFCKSFIKKFFLLYYIAFLMFDSCLVEFSSRFIPLCSFTSSQVLVHLSPAVF